MFSKAGSVVFWSILILAAGLMPGCSTEEERVWNHGMELGAVVAPSGHAVDAGQKILEEGGNAVDAAIAAAFALNAAEPYGSGIGGGGFMLVYPAGEEPVLIDYREKAPAAAEPAMYVDVTPEEKILGGLSVAVPGQLRGMEKAAELFGSKDMADLMAPAIKLAQEGVVVNPTFSDALVNHMTTLSGCDEARGIFYQEDGFPYTEGQTIKQPQLAETLAYLAEEGFDTFYKGELAEEIVSVVREDGGILTLEDLKGYTEARVTTPLKGEFGEYTLYTSSLPAAGGMNLLQLLNIWRHYPGQIYEQPNYEEIAYLVDAMKVIFSDREKYIGDPDFVDVPVERLVSEKYFEEKASEILNSEFEARALTDLGGSTTNFLTADSEGNVVVVTQSIGYFFGSGIMVPGRGFFLTDMMYCFSSDPESPNAPEGGKMPVSSMAPAIFLKDGEPVLAIGSPGARRIVTSIAQVALNYFERGHTLEEAIEAPRFHYEAGAFRMEPGFSPGDVEKLKEMGLESTILYIGSPTAIGWKAGEPEGHADSRRVGGGVFIQ